MPGDLPDLPDQPDWRITLPSWRRAEAEIVKDYERKGAMKDPYRRPVPAGESRTSTKGETT